MIADYSKFERPPQYFLTLRALLAFRKQYGRLPAPGNPVPLSSHIHTHSHTHSLSSISIMQ